VSTHRRRRVLALLGTAFATAAVFGCLGLAAALTLLPGGRQPGSVNSATVRHESEAAEPATRRA
jgi:hypothetical protein